MDSSEGSNPKTAGGTDHGDEDDHNDLVDAEDRGDGDDARRSHDEAKTVIKVNAAYAGDSHVAQSV